MTKPEAKFFQECEFCHKMVETDASGLPTVRLPMRYIRTDGTKDGLATETASICGTCRERLYVRLSKALDLKHIEYGGAAIHWLDDVMSEDEEVTENEI